MDDKIEKKNAENDEQKEDVQNKEGEIKQKNEELDVEYDVEIPGEEAKDQTDEEQQLNEEKDKERNDEFDNFQEQINSLKDDLAGITTHLNEAKTNLNNEVDSAKKKIDEYARESEKKITIAKDELKNEIENAIKDCKETNEKDLEKLKEQLKDEINKQTSKQVEMVGIFSSVVALLVINVNIVRSADTFLKATLLMSGLLCIVIIFAYLIHFFFNGNQNVKIGKGLTAAVVILVILTAVGFGTEFKIGEALKNISSSEKDNVSVEAKFEQNFSDHSDRNVVIREFDISPKDSVVKTLKNADGKKKDTKTEPAKKNHPMQENRK